MGSLTPRGRENLGLKQSQNMKLQIAAKPSVLRYHLPNTDEQGDSAFYQMSLALVISRALLLCAIADCQLLLFSLKEYFT